MTTTPIGWIMFCHENADDCRTSGMASLDTTPREATAKFLALLSGVNDRVNAEIKPVTDRELYGVEERWTYATTKGDCEDFALDKRRDLHAAGVPLGDLLMTVVRKRNGEGHAVLTVRTSEGDFILDNLDRRVRPWNETSYTFVKRQSSTDPNIWLAVVGDGDVAVGALRK
ncbi:transglutaminase-like cysteine peptidase [Aureimonas leprariae]|nr:transglutaminase-like cysteine peptidase [Aureimonas leprariae]